MNILKIQLSILITFITAFTHAQSSDPVILKINNTAIQQSEFEYAYQKALTNSVDKHLTAGDFMESYINLKLNIEEAKNLGFNKRLDFINEYTNYLEQLESPYLTDSITPEIVAKDIYANLKENTEISRIFIAFNKDNLLPEDTLEAYNKALYIRNLYKNENFEDLVIKYSDDTLFKKSSTPGYLGWRKSLSYPYPLEKVIYAAAVNSVTHPIRTNVGYDIIKLHNRKADPGQVNIAHIMLAYPDNSTASEKDSVTTLAKEISKELAEGKSFEELAARYSIDRTSAERGGNLGWFGVQRPLPTAVEDIIYGMKEIGDVTSPVELEYGYHIFKLLDKIPFADWETMKPKILEAIEGSDRKDVLIQKQIERLTKEYPYKLEQNIYNGLEQAANKYNLSDSLYFKTISPIREKTLLHVRDKSYTVKDFIFFLEKNPQTEYTLSTDILSSKIRSFILDRLTEAKRQNIFNENPDIKYLAQEFYDGILYFNIMDQEVWEKARSDRHALQELFTQNPSKYKWDSPKFKGYIIHAKDKSILKKVQDVIKKNKKAKDLDKILIKELNTDNTSNIVVEKGLWAKGENAFIDRKIFKTNSEREIIGYPEYTIEGKMISSPEELSDVLGMVTNDYQAILEKEWIDYLRNKYKIEINEGILQFIK